ncbi:2-(hydroxymethyl)glutarate dehydrogenase [Rhodobacteraceae bacterium THAF1]|nr:2-(hydroxymethyl)glutarate dehydrogenase [Palleronia sp. THAF1]VDC17411.1 2-(hydroxymethyl)glutarate dehydrogenase [Rhodobacteraceae bacterium THAF1]
MIGLGAMGQGMARNIMAAGIPLAGFDLSEGARARFAQEGGSTGEDAAHVVADCDLLLVMVATAAQAEAALFAGVTDALAPGAVVILSSTVAPSEARAIAARLAEQGHTMLDAPVSGGQVGADDGRLTIMASGPQVAFDRADTVLAAISKKVHRLGDEAGLGATYKVVHQLAAGVHLVAAAELMAFGAKAGCDPQTLFDIVSSSAGQSWMMDDRAPRMMTTGATATSTVDIFIKDLGLVVQTARDSGAPVPLAAAAYQMMIGASGMGLGREDDSAVIRAYEALTGHPVHKD